MTRKLAVLLLLPLFFAALAFAQGGATGAISGAVQDASGAVIANAKVSVTSEATGEVLRQTKTDASGLFNATLLPVGTYTVEVSAAGFPVTKIPGVVVRITETTRMTTVLKLSAVKEVVEVQAQAEQINTTDATTGESISSTTLNTLPLATRNFQQLLDLSAGASASLNNAASLGRGDVRIDVNGGREDNNNYLIEGVSASDYSFGELTYTPVPNPDSIQEFKVGTSLYDATQGRNGGGNINAILKSGTSAFHGDLWEYFRNSDLDAEDFFLGKFQLKQNIFGGDFGGPVLEKAKLGYFYVNYQGTRQRSGDSLGTYISGALLTALPTARDCTTLVNTFFPTGLPSYATNTGVDCGLDPVAFNLLNTKGTQFGPGNGGGWLIPSVGTPGTPSTGPSAGIPNTGLLTLSTPGRYRDDQFTANWDRDFNQGKDRLSWRFFWSDSETYQPFGADNLQVQTGGPAAATDLNFPLDIPLRGRFGSIAETHSFSNALINEFRFGLNVISDSLENVTPPGTSPSTLGINNGYGQPDMYRLQFLGSGYQAGPFPNQLQSALSDSFVWLDTVSWTHAHHSFRFGGEIDRTTLRRNLPVLDNPLLLFIPGTDPAGLWDFQDFLLGQPFVAEGGSGDSKHDYHIPAFGAFAQDDYRIRPDLTLNLGLRTEWVGAASDSLCHLGNTIPGNANTSGFPFVYPKCANKYGIPGLTGTLNNAALNNEYSTVIEPRIGLAYDIGGKHKTVVRGGYGIYSVREDIGAVDNLSFSPPFYPVSILVGQTPYESLTSMYAGILPPLGAPPSAAYLPTPSFITGFSGAPAGQPATNGGPSFSGTAFNYIGLAVPLHWIVPTTQQWNLTVQRQLGGNWVLELGYVGTKGTHLRSTYDPAQANVIPTGGSLTVHGQGGTPYVLTQNTVANAAARGLYVGIDPGAFEAFAPNSDSRYNGFQTTVSHHFSKGLYLQSAYTWSKSIDDVSTASVAFITRVNNQLSGAASRGLSDFDRRHRFVTSLNYALPFMNNRHDAVGYVAGGWEVDSVIVAQSGTPITIQDSDGGLAYDITTPNIATADFASGFGCGNALNSGGLLSKVANWVNPAAYQKVGLVPNAGAAPPGVTPPTGFGDSPRNCIIGPKQVNVDFTLGKTFKIGERQNLRFRTEFFNLFNHPSFQNPLNFGFADVEQGSNIGKITQTVGTPRLVQFALKYSF